MHLLPPNILQPHIQILDPLHDILNLALIRALDLAGVADRQIQRELDAAGRLAVGEVARAMRGVARGEADAVVAGVGGREGEAALGGALLRDDAVVVVEGLFDGDVDLHGLVLVVGSLVVVPAFGFVVAWYSMLELGLRD